MLEMNLLQKIEESKRYLSEQVRDFPRTLVVTGSGLAGLVENMEREKEIAYSHIPHFRHSTVKGHPGYLVIGKTGGERIALMHGRLHYYEGYSMEEVVFPFRVLASCGVSVFLLTNASGALHTGIEPTDLVLLRDHINLMGTNPLVGHNYEELGVRFPDMTQLYDPALNTLATECAQRLGVPLKGGVYVGLHGPSYETPAEIRMFRALGGDLVGMSTVPEAIAIHHMGKKVLAISCVTNFAAGVLPQALAHEEVLESAQKAYGNFSVLIQEIVQEIGKHHV